MKLVMKFLESETIELTPGQNFDHPFQLLPCNFLAGWDLVNKSGPRNKKIGAQARFFDQIPAIPRVKNHP